MLDWFFGRRRRELPEYSRLRATPSRQLPLDLTEQLQAEPFSVRRNALQNDLREAPHRPAEDQPLFTILLLPKQGGVLTIMRPDRPAPCLPMFSSPFRAADYAQTLVAPGDPVHYLSSTPQECLRMLSDLVGRGVDTFALDRCPRCAAFTAIGNQSMRTVNDLLAVWSIHKGTELARADLYFSYALDCARNGALETARDVALEAVGHVSIDDPRLHLLLGQVAVAARDRPLLAEAKSFLQCLRLAPWERKLDEVEQSGSPDYEVERWPLERRASWPPRR